MVTEYPASSSSSSGPKASSSSKPSNATRSSFGICLRCWDGARCFSGDLKQREGEMGEMQRVSVSTSIVGLETALMTALDVAPVLQVGLGALLDFFLFF